MAVIPTELIAPAYNPATWAERGRIDEIFSRIRTQFPLAQAQVPGYDPYWIVSRHADI